MDIHLSKVKPACEGGTPVRTSMLPFHRASIGNEEIEAVVQTLRSGWITTGPKTKQFERELAEYLGMPSVVCMNSCTSALHLALIICKIGQGDEVITSPITFPSTANVILHTGAEVVFADIDPNTLNIDPKSVEKRITPRTKAVMPVHMAGFPCDLDALEAISSAHKLLMIQDSAHAIESKWSGRTLPSYGDFSAYSFYATKNITCAEGGALTSKHPDYMEQAALLSLFGISKDAWKRYNVPGYQHWETLAPGYKYNMFDIQASMGLVQIKRIEEFRKKRIEYVKKYDEAFHNHPAIEPFVYPPQGHHAHYLYVLRLKIDQLKITRDSFMKAIESENIGIGIHFRSLLDQLYYKNRYPGQNASCPESQKASNSILSLPLYPGLTPGDVQDVIHAVLKILDYYAK